MDGLNVIVSGPNPDTNLYDIPRKPAFTLDVKVNGSDVDFPN